LDLKHQLEIFEMIEKEVSSGKTVIVTMHDLSLVSRFSDRIIMLKEGSIYSDGTASTLSAAKINSLIFLKAISSKPSFEITSAVISLSC
jgi:iron complex transport system ATP-binding protein